MNYMNSGEQTHSTTRTIRVFEGNCEQISTTVETLQREFFIRATEIKFAIIESGRRRNLPGYPHAIDCILSGMEPDAYIDRLISKPRALLKLLEGGK